MPHAVFRHSVTQPADPSIRRIPLTKGQSTIVDTTDYDWLMQWNWHAHFAKNTGTFYAACEIWLGNGKRTLLYMHIAIFRVPEGMKRDHINRDTLDNRRANLRVATTAQNNYNCRIYKNNKSGHKGVWWSRENKRWEAVVYFKGLRHWLGRFNNIEDAVAAREAKEKEVVGNFVPLEPSKNPISVVGGDGNSGPTGALSSN